MDTSKLCMISGMLLNNDHPAQAFFRVKVDNSEHSGWVFLSGEEDENYINDLSNFSNNQLSTVLLNNPDIRRYLDADVGTHYVRDTERNIFWDINEMNAKYVDNESRASNPGNIRVEPLLWMRNYLFDTSVLVIGLLISLWLCFVLSWLFLLLVAFFVRGIYVYWGHLREHFIYGCILPGIVVTLKPTLVAVYADVSKGNGSYPAVKIVSIELSRTRTKALRLHDRIALVALFTDKDKTAPYWTDFTPLAVESATSDRAIVERVWQSIDEKDWQEVEKTLPQLKGATVESYHTFNHTTNSWERKSPSKKT